MYSDVLMRAACALVLMSAPASAQNLLFILDSSGSMWGKLDGTAKVETAKSALSTLIDDVSADARIGLMVYGHRYDRNDPGACADIELLTPVGQATPDKVVGWIKNIVPKGKTPIAAALQQAPEAFIGLETGNNNVVLISDGIETCDGDPCAVAQSLASSANISVRVHVVGFDVTEEDRKQLECIADLGKGKYFPASSTAGFTAAVTEAVKLAQAGPSSEPDPAPSEPQRQRVFLDDFDGVDLGEQWTVNNQDPEAFLVEDGKMLMVASQVSGFDRKDMPNLITLNEPLPKGDWDAIVTFNGEFKTGRDQFWFGLRKDNENFLSSDLSMYFRPGSDFDYVTLRLLKHSGGKPVDTSVRIHRSNEGDEAWEKYLARFEDSQSTVTLSKRGRNYYTSFRNDSMKGEDGQPRLWETDKLTSLRSPGLLTLGVSKWADTSGEVLTFIDSVEIVTVKE